MMLAESMVRSRKMEKKRRVSWLVEGSGKVKRSGGKKYGMRRMKNEKSLEDKSNGVYRGEYRRKIRRCVFVHEIDLG